MPVILPDEGYARWLDPKNEDVAALQGLLRPYAAEETTAFPISTLVNSPRNDQPECIARLARWGHRVIASARAWVRTVGTAHCKRLQPQVSAKEPLAMAFVVKVDSSAGEVMWIGLFRYNEHRAFGPRELAEVFETKHDAQAAINGLPGGLIGAGLTFKIESVNQPADGRAALYTFGVPIGGLFRG